MPATPPRAFSLAGLLSEATTFLAEHHVPSPRLDAEVLLAHAIGGSKTEMYARLRAELAPHPRAVFWQTLRRRARREPVPYITGVQEFWSLDFSVDRHVLIPRPETERVVEVALDALGSPAAPRILDLGTGSACIAAALALELPQAQVWACDVSAEALAVARANAVRHGVADRITFIRTDMREWPATLSGFDLIVTNPPYIAEPDFVSLQAEVRDWEPRLALNGGRDGLNFYRSLLQDCPGRLRRGGWLVMEVGASQSEAVLRMARSQGGLGAYRLSYDYGGWPRVVAARRQGER